jgi:hypothetical protein
MRETRPILIVSTGRTGTIFFARLFGDLYPQVAAYHERGLSRPIQILTNLHFAHLFPRSGLRAAWRILKGAEIRNCAKPFHLDANCFLYGLPALAPELYPGLRVIHIVRDPRSYVTSHLNFSRQKFSSFVANYLTPFWQPSPFLTGEVPLSRLPGFSRFDRYCWIWTFKNRIMASARKTQEYYLQIRFEELFSGADPQQVFEQITDFIGLPRPGGIAGRLREPVNAAARRSISDWPEWAPAQCAALQSRCGEQMAVFGYGQEPLWLEKLAGAQK